jgi:two-component system, OmpR family, phosphate regulon sensor histidine kinase PhoR
MLNISQTAIIDVIEAPALLIADEQIIHANMAAIDLLGGHIVGQDVRLAIRAPHAIEALLSPGGGQARIKGLSVPGSIWSLTVKEMPEGNRLAILRDQSIQASVARAHSDFVANASHELRTPLASVLGYVETLRDPKAGEDAETRNRFLAIIQREAERMQALVEDLMSLSRIEAEKHEEPTDKIDLVALVKQVIGEQPAKRATHLETEAETAFIAGDSGQVGQVLRNLVDNAHKYGKAGAPVQIALEVSGTGWIRLTVQDQGAGIPPEHLPRLTERFYRVDPGRSRDAGGTGLGLSIVKHIVERHRGRFDISSREGIGTTASVMIPVHKS